MLSRSAKLAFVAACACNLAFSVMSAYAFETVSYPAFIGGGLAFVVAAALALMVLRDSDGLDRTWIKAALVFLALGPVAFWTLEMPATAEVICIDRCYGVQTEAIIERALADVAQSRIAMVAAASAAVVCAVRAIAVMRDEFAV